MGRRITLANNVIPKAFLGLWTNNMDLNLGMRLRDKPEKPQSLLVKCWNLQLGVGVKDVKINRKGPLFPPLQGQNGGSRGILAARVGYDESVYRLEKSLVQGPLRQLYGFLEFNIAIGNGFLRY
jgi:hypothetical protein